MMTKWLDSYAAELEIVQHNDLGTTATAVGTDTTAGVSQEPATLKPCCARIRTVDGMTGWCGLPDQHAGDHHGVTSAEMGIPSDYSKGRRK